MYISPDLSINPLTIMISWVATVEGKKIHRDCWSFQKAADYFSHPSPAIVTKEEREAKPLFSFNIYGPDKPRGKQNVEAMTGLVFDFDNKEAFVPIQTVLDTLNEKRLVYFFYTSHSHTAERPRWRLILPFAQPLPVSEWNAVYDQMVILIGNPPGIDHSASRDIAHIWFPPYKNADHPFDSMACREGFVIEPLDINLLLTLEQKALYRGQQEEKQKTVQPKNTSVSFLEGSNVSPDQIKEMLGYISPDCGRPQWISIGMALHHHFGGTNTGFNLWLEWSQKSAIKFTGVQSLLTPWEGFRDKSEQVTIATLIHYAQENGYVLFPVLDIQLIDSREQGAERDLTPEEESELEEHQIARSLQSRETSHEGKPCAAEDTKVPDCQFDFSEYEKTDIYDLPSPLLKEIYSYLLQCGRYRTPLYALGAAIPLAGFLLRNHLQSYTKLRTNFMTLSIGMSGTGKTQMLTAIQNILKFFHQQSHLVMSLGTIQGCIEALRQKGGSLLLVQDEASYWAKGTKNKNLSIHEDAVGKFRLEMFSCPLFYIPPAAKSADLTPIEEPFFAEISSATPEILKHFSPDDYSRGLLPRFLVFKQDDSSFERNVLFDGEFPSSLRATLEKYKPQQNYDRLRGLLDEEASLFFTRFDKKVEGMRHQVLFEKTHAYPFQVDALLARLCEHAEKLSLLGAILNVAHYTIPLKAIQWGVAVTLLSFRNLCQIMEEGIYENKTEEDRGRVLSIIKKKSKEALPTSKRGWITRSVISCNIKFLKARELTEILNKLQEEGVIEIAKRGENQIYVKYIEKGKSS